MYLNATLCLTFTCLLFAFSNCALPYQSNILHSCLGFAIAMSQPVFVSQLAFTDTYKSPVCYLLPPASYLVADIAQTIVPRQLARHFVTYLVREAMGSGESVTNAGLVTNLKCCIFLVQMRSTLQCSRIDCNMLLFVIVLKKKEVHFGG